MKKLGCLVFIVLLAAGGYWAYSTGWIRFGRPEPGGGRRESGAAGVAGAPTWQALTPDGAKRADAALRQLSSTRGPVYVNVTPGDLAAYILQELTRALPTSADSIQAAAFGDRLYVRAVVPVKDLGGAKGLGPLGALLGDRERIELGGALRIVHPGLAELQVKEMKIRELRLPQALIPRLIGQMSRSARPAGLAPDGIPLQTPPYIADVRVTDGRVTLYKTQLER